MKSGTTLLEKTARLLGLHVHRVFLLGNPSGYSLPDSLKNMRPIPDDPPDVGPLGGLHALLQQCDADEAVLLIACDMPYLTGKLLERLLSVAQEATDEWDVVIPTTSGDEGQLTRQRHPCCALYRPTCLPTIQNAFAAHGHGMMSLLKHLRVIDVPLNKHEARWLTNWNTPDNIDD